MTWFGHYPVNGGYGIAGCNYVRALLRAGVKVDLVFPDHVHPPNDLKTSLRTRRSMSDYGPMSVTVDHGFPYFWNRWPDRRRIGMVVYETTVIPENWVPFMNDVDEVWTSSRFCKAVFEGCGVKVPIRVFSHCLDLERFTPMGPELTLPTKKGFRFLGISDLARRKAWDVYLRAYLEEFSGDEDVCLVFRSFIGAEEAWKTIRNMTSKSNPPEILVVPEWVPDMPSLLRAAHAVLALGRGEGFGLLGLEGLACGCSVVGLAWGGQEEYLHPRNSFLVGYDLLQGEKVQMDLARFSDLKAGLDRGGVFPEPRLESVREQMRSCFEGREEAYTKKLRGLSDAQAFSLECVGAGMKSRLEEVDG